MSGSVANTEEDWKPLATPESDPVAESCGADWVARLQPPPRSERDASDLGDAAIIIWNFCSRLQYTLGDHAPPAGRERAARPLAAAGCKGFRPSSCGGRAVRPNAEYQPGYDGSPGGAQEFTDVRIPRRMARPFEWATRRSRVGTDRFGTGPVGTGSGVPTRLRRVARRRAGPARPFVSITIRTLLGPTKLATKLSRQSLKRTSNSRKNTIMSLFWHTPDFLDPVDLS